MKIKRIVVDKDVYEKIESLKLNPSKSVSQVLRRKLSMGRMDVPALELLRMNEEEGGILKMTPEGLDEVEAAREEWSSRTKRGVTGAEILAMIENGSYPRVGWTDEEIEGIENVDGLKTEKV